ncbi:hypothetical protein E2I00_011871, partial [Balaenoptera physalus]
PPSVSPACVTVAMDGAAAVQEGLLEDRPGSGISARPEAPPKPTGSLTSLDQWDEAQCSTEASLPLEKEEQVRLQARKRLEEQLQQYRVKRQQERSSQPVTKTRLFSTLDPELMLNPETLPRASAVAMTKEYSFLRTSVPRGPKVGSLGLLAHPKEKKSFKSSKIRSLADYRTEDSDARNSGGNVPAPDSARASLEQNRGSGTSVVSELSLCPEADDRLEDASLTGDNVSEADGTESDSSCYSSVSARGTAGLPVNTGGARQAPYGASSQEIATGALGQLPSISDVLQAAAAERQEQRQKVNGETRRRADSICSSVSMESSVAETHDEMLQVLKEKMRLEGQLEALSLEASQALKEKAELQAQLAALHTRLRAQLEHSHSSQQRQDSLSSEVDTLKQSCWDLEQAMGALQNMLEAKNASLASSNSDLRLAEGQYQRLVAKVEDMQRSILSKDNTVHDLRQQMTALQSQLQQVQLERTTLTSKLKASQAEIASLQSVRQWYQQQLALAQEARVRLQGEMAHIQIGQMSQAGLLEHLKLENVSLSHQLTETQQRSIKEKERIAAQLQGIEADMLDQEAAFVQIQEAKTMVEEDLQRRLEEFEDEKEQLQKTVKLTLHQRDQQLEALQQEHLDLLKQFTSTQETLQSREQALGDLQVHRDELQARLDELQGEAAARDDAIRFLQNEKIVLEVAVQAAQSGREQSDRDAKCLEEGAQDTSETLEQLTQELAIKSSQVEHLQQEAASLKKQAQKIKEQFLQQKVMVEAYRRDATSKDQLIGELKAAKRRLDSEVKGQRQEAVRLQGEKRAVESLQAVTEQKRKLKQLGSDLSSAQKEEALAAKEAAEAELSQLRAQAASGGGGGDHTLHERVQALEAELQAVGHSKRMLERELQEVIALTGQQLEEQRERLQESRGFRRKIKCLEESNKKLALDLEHERGKLMGLGQSSAALREHNGILETALAKREADLVQLNLQVQAVLQRKEEEDRQMKQLVQALQAALQKEKVTVHSLEEQVAAAQAEAGHNRRHFKAATLELSEVKKELQAKEQEVQRLQAEADGLQIQEGKHSQEIAQFQAELAEARTQLQLLQKQLDEQLSKEPAGNQEMENLKWEVDQKEREIQSLQQQLDLTERQSKQELDGVQQSSQNIKSELEMVREDLSLTQKDKFMLQVKRKEPKGEASSSSPVTPVKIPDCPVPASLLEELLRPPPAVSKEPLKNLNSCLQQLKYDCSGLHLVVFTNKLQVSVGRIFPVASTARPAEASGSVVFLG